MTIRMASIFAAAPLVLGVLTLVLYLLTDAHLFTIAGLFVVLLGLGSVLIAGLLVVIYWWSARRCERSVRQAVRRRSILVLFLIATNFPAAFVCSQIGFSRMMSHRFTILNDGREPIRSFVLIGPGVRSDVGPIAPGDTVHARFRTTSDGPLTFELTAHDGSQTSGTLDEYVSNVGAERRAVTINGTDVTVSP